jgi:DNA repair protein RadA/Sms
MAYLCTNCRQRSPFFHLSCPDCGAWNSFQNQAMGDSPDDSIPIALPNMVLPPVPRTKTRIAQVDTLLGGGFVASSSVLLTGAPGAGKSTLVLQLLRKMNVPSLYVSGEESLGQLKLRADRLKINSPKIFLLFETNVARVLRHADASRPEVLVVDSIQTVYSDVSDSIPGGPAQIRKCSYLLRRAAHQKGFILILVGQVTKGAKAAGPKLLEHAVDVVLTLEAEEGSGPKRELTASKNRFGSTQPRCRLTMGEAGLEFSRIRRAGHDEG